MRAHQPHRLTRGGAQRGQAETPGKVGDEPPRLRDVDDTRRKSQRERRRPNEQRVARRLVMGEIALGELISKELVGRRVVGDRAAALRRAPSPPAPPATTGKLRAGNLRRRRADHVVRECRAPASAQLLRRPVASRHPDANRERLQRRAPRREAHMAPQRAPADRLLIYSRWDRPRPQGLDQIFVAFRSRPRAQRHLVTVSCGCCRTIERYKASPASCNCWSSPWSISRTSFRSSQAAGCANVQTVRMSSTKIIASSC